MTKSPIEILVVDDHLDTLTLLEAALDGRPDLHLRTASTAHEALALVASAPPDVAAVDLQLPDLSGAELAHRVHRLCPSCLLIALTGFDPVAARERVGDAPFVRLVQKPPDLSELMNLFDDLVVEARARRR